MIYFLELTIVAVVTLALGSVVAIGMLRNDRRRSPPRHNGISPKF